MPWIGRKKLALVPVYRPNAHPPDQIPDDWPDLLDQRLFYDPDPKTGADRSLRAYIHTVSSGLADFDAYIYYPMQTVDAQDVPPNALEGAPADFGLTIGSYLRGPQVRADAAALVMLGGVGAGTSAGFWCRFVMAEGVGVWAMEFMHSLTGFGDLYPFGGNMGAFDEMACSCGTHPSAFTKRAIQWLDPSAVAPLTLLRNQGFVLHSVGLIQPPPKDSRVTAVQIGSTVPYYMVEARKKVDQFDAGIPSEGVIVYRIQTEDPLGHAQNSTAPIQLVTPTALGVGQAFVIEERGISVKVNATLPGAFLVTIDPMPWRSVSEGKTVPGGSIAAVRWGQGFALFVANPVVYTTGGDPQGGFGPWAVVSDGFVTVPGAPVTTVPWGTRFALFATDSNGSVCTAAGDPQNGLLGAWAAVSDGFVTVPGAPVTVVPWGTRFALFATDSNGSVCTAAGDPQNGLLGGWAAVSDGFVTVPGAPVTVVPWGTRFALFATDSNGSVCTAAGDPQNGLLGAWAAVSDGFVTVPGASVTVVPWGTRFALFATDSNGSVCTAAGDPQNGLLGAWATVAEGKSVPGAFIAAVPSGASFELFVTDLNGGIYKSAGDPQAGFGLWSYLPGISASPGSPITAVPAGADIVLFVADSSGGIFVSTKTYN